ncbi:MAG: hypothetical protein UV41_C0034G0006 [Candidatus Daviesbacteria bacterium GW2011_GWA2_42_7]|uniref:Uncharacterized protein n=1 Tax=Candidatus Daviesbacteria bacterium GW2011_GWA2_42_7 TaxID=1618425 RepID=A0A0G1BAE6_9BACT|nr:MAG: hypothetical protein UV41_C0034G0006 [Candidatus Daviesbacteria bacterium GW2011_GWA2_42_7]OGE18927.1 MAG: hypothetical protein A2874_03775 [Candidatus Daviesbacteria bacterium RIFCSPHIGHO2_01_FULL_43_17]
MEIPNEAGKISLEQAPKGRNHFARFLEWVGGGVDLPPEPTTLGQSGIFPKGWLDDEDPKD